MAVKSANFTAGRLNASSGLSLSYARPWAANSKETGLNIAANTPYFDRPAALVQPIRAVAAGTLSTLLGSAVLGCSGTWADGSGAIVVTTWNAATSSGYVAIETEATFSEGANAWNDAAWAARGMAKRTIQLAYSGSEPLANGRSNVLNMLRNATAAQGETLRERCVPVCFGSTMGVPVAFCQVFQIGTANDIANALLMWAENLSPTGFFASEVASAQANADNKWFMALRFANHGVTAGSGRIQSCHTWYRVSATEMWLPTVDYRGAGDGLLGGIVGLVRAVKLPSGLWEIQEPINLYEEPGGSTWSVHFQGAVITRGPAGELTVRVTRQQSESNVITITRTDPANYAQGVVTIDPRTITGGSTTTVTFAGSAADAAKLTAGAFLTVAGNSGSGVNGRRRITSASHNAGTVTVTFDAASAGSPVAGEGMVCGSCQASANHPWYAITGGTTTTITFAGNATDAANFQPGDTITLRGTGGFSMSGTYTQAINNAFTVQSCTHSSGVCTITTTTTMPASPTAAGHVSKNTLRFTRNGWSVNQCEIGVPQSLCVLAGITVRQRHSGFLGGCQIDDAATRTIMGTDNGGGYGVIVTSPTNPLTQRADYQWVGGRLLSQYCAGLTWDWYNHFNGFYNTTYGPELLLGNTGLANHERKDLASSDGLYFGDMTTNRRSFVCGRKVLSIRGSTFSTFTRPIVQTSRGLLTSWTGANYAANTIAAGPNAVDTNVSRTLNVARSTEAALNAALGITGRTVPLPPTPAPVIRLTNPSTTTVDTTKFFGGTVDIHNGVTGLRLVPGRTKIKGWTYCLPGPVNVAANLNAFPFAHNKHDVLYEMNTGGTTGNGGLRATAPAGIFDSPGWFPFTHEFDSNANINWSGYSSGSSINVSAMRLRAGNGTFEWTDALFCISEMVCGGVSGAVDWPVVPLPITSGTQTAPTPAETMSWRVGGFSPGTNWLLACGGVLPIDGWEYSDEPARLPTTPRLFTLRQNGAREIRASFDLGDRSFTFTDGTNSTRVASPFAGTALSGGTFSTTGNTITGAPNISGGDLTGTTLFVTSGGGNDYPTRYGCARVTTHSGTTITLDRPVAANGATVSGTFNTTGGEFCPKRGGSMHFAVYVQGNSYTFIASVNGEWNSAAATWPLVDGQNIQPTEFIGMDSDEGNAQAVAWAYVTMDDNAATSQTVNSIVDLMNSGEFVRKDSEGGGTAAGFAAGLATGMSIGGA